MSLAQDEDFLMRPVLAGMYRLESILDGTLDLADIQWANDALAVKNENERRWHEAQEEKR